MASVSALLLLLLLLLVLCRTDPSPTAAMLFVVPARNGGWETHSSIDGNGADGTASGGERRPLMERE